MHPFDRNHFRGYSISYAEIDNLTDCQKYRFFIKLNTSGTPIDKNHIKRVEKLYNESIR